MVKVLITERIARTGLDLLEARSDCEADFHPRIARDRLLEIIGEYDGMITRSLTAVDRELIERALKLRVIARAGVGVDNIDIDAATEHGILVVNCPYGNVVSAAEHTWALLLAVCRKLIDAHQTLKGGAWDRQSFRGRELREKTLGIVGLGKVGSRVARMGQGFGMEVLAYDPYIADERFESFDVKKMARLDELLQRSHVLSVHTPKTEETYGMIGKRELSLLPRGAVVLNTARGGIVVEEALFKSLELEHVAGAGIDVWDGEPCTETPLQLHPRVVCTPHLGASTREAQDRVSYTAADQVLKALDGKTVDHPINMPNISASLLEELRHYVVLAEKIGAFGEQYAFGNISRIRLLYQGKLAKVDTALLPLALAKGLVSVTSDEKVTYVNAPQKLQDRGIQLVEACDPVSPSYVSIIKATFHSPEGDLTVGGTVIENRYPMICQIGDYFFDVVPRGYLLLLSNYDRPGVIGEVGTLLGSSGINIARWELGRKKPGERALAAIGVDSAVPPHVMERIRRAKNVIDVRQIKL
jgi:D-3-phosphoglycerate dehydrogenase